MATALDATPFNFVAIVLCVSVGAGLLGSLLGLGGGLILIPVLTLVLKVDIRYAVGASIVSVIATSSGAAAAYVRDGLANMRVAMFLELATVAGAVSGAMLAGMLPAPRRWLPAQRPESLRTRAGVIIGRLEREGRISATQAREAQAELSRYFGVPPAPGFVAEARNGPPAES